MTVANSERLDPASATERLHALEQEEIRAATADIADPEVRERLIQVVQREIARRRRMMAASASG